MRTALAFSRQPPPRPEELIALQKQDVESRTHNAIFYTIATLKQAKGGKVSSLANHRLVNLRIMRQHPLSSPPPLLDILITPVALLCVGPIQDAVKIPAPVKGAEVCARHVDAGDPVVRDYGDIRLAHERGSKDVYAVICEICG